MTRRPLFLNTVAASAAFVVAAVIVPLGAVNSARAPARTVWGDEQALASLPPQICDLDEIAIDSAGNVVIAGTTSSPAFPTTPDAADRSCGTDGDAFVMILSPAGDVRYSTCLGGPMTESWVDIAPAPDGSIWVAATTDLRVRPEGYSTTECHVAIWRLRPDRSALDGPVWLGGPGTLAWLVEAETGPGGTVWVLANTRSSSVPVVNAWQPALAGDYDMLLARFEPGRADPLLLTYLGGSSLDQGLSLAVAPDGDAVVSGRSLSTDFPVVRPAQPNSGGACDIVLSRLDVSGRWLEYSTFLGGSSWEESVQVAVDADGTVFAAGRTTSPDFPSTGESIRRNANLDNFFVALDGAGRLRSAALIGHRVERVPADDVGAGVRNVFARDDGSVLVTGAWFSDNLLRGGWFAALTNNAGVDLRPPLLTETGADNCCIAEAETLAGAYLYVVRTNLFMPAWKRYLARLSVSGTRPESPAGWHAHR